MILFIALALAAVVPPQQTPTCENLRAKIASAYHFKPSKLNNAEQKVKSEQMDEVWSMVEKNKALAPCLQTELEKTTDDNWFLFDGSTLLLRVLRTPASRAIHLKALKQVDLVDVDLAEWVRAATSLALDDMDISPVAERWLGLTNPRFAIPIHAFDVDKATGAAILFFSMNESVATPALVRIANDPKHASRGDAVYMLLDQATPESWNALRKMDISWLSKDKRDTVAKMLADPPRYKPRAIPKTTRESFLTQFRAAANGDFRPFMQRAEEVNDGELDVVAVMKPEDVPLIRKVRRAAWASGNPHLFDLVPYLNRILYTLVWKPN
jgi:hypothetical protein